MLLPIVRAIKHTSKRTINTCIHQTMIQRRSMHQLSRNTTRHVTRNIITRSRKPNHTFRQMSLAARVAENLKSNRPLQLYLAVSVALGGGAYLYKKYFKVNEQENVVIKTALDTISKSALPQLIHQLDQSQVIVTRGTKLSGTVEANLADMCFDVRIARKGATVPAGAALNDDNIVGVYKAHVQAHRDGKDLVTSVGIQQTPAAEPAQPVARPWHLDTLTISSPLKGVSYQYDPVTKSFTRCDAFIPVTAAPSKPKPARAEEPTAGRSWVAAQRVGFGLMVILAAVTGSLAFYRWRYKDRVQKHLGLLVENALKNTLHSDAMAVSKKLITVNPVQPTVKELSTTIKPGMAVGEYEADVAGKTAFISAQAIRDIKAGTQVSQQWKLLHASMRTKDGKTRQLSFK